MRIDEWCEMNSVDRAPAKNDRSWSDPRPANVRTDRPANVIMRMGNGWPGGMPPNACMGRRLVSRGRLCGGETG